MGPSVRPVGPFTSRNATIPDTNACIVGDAHNFMTQQGFMTLQDFMKHQDFMTHQDFKKHQDFLTHQDSMTRQEVKPGPCFSNARIVGDARNFMKHQDSMMHQDFMTRQEAKLNSWFPNQTNDPEPHPAFQVPDFEAMP